MSSGWQHYYKQTGARPPRRTLLFALERFAGTPPAQPLAVDLGCGSGRDTITLLARGWSVVAVDAEPDAIAALRARRDVPPDAALTTRVTRFETMLWEPCALINSSFALPLISPQDFTALWPRMLRALTPGGRIACQLFGPHDSWAGNTALTFHSRPELEALLAPLDTELLEEEETDSITPRGAAKHWHLFHIVARKP